MQMVNFRIGPGVSDHIVGAGLLAIVFGPAIAVVAMAAIVSLQALLFGDGGVAALGANVLNMAVISVLVAWAAHKALARTLPTASIAVATTAAVMAGAVAAAVEVMMSGPYGAGLLGLMVVLHLLSGAVEAIVTTAVVKALAGTGLVAFGNGRVKRA
jgi:cobalt/nickel transport system permease protein